MDKKRYTNLGTFESKDKAMLFRNVKVLCVCGGLVALSVGIALKLNRITAVDLSTSTPVLLIVKL